MKIGKIPFVFSAAMFVATTILGSSGTAIAQDQPAQESKDERALNLLKGMSSTLAQAKSLSFKVRGLVPFSAPTGQYISLFASSRVLLQRPDKLFVESRGDLFPNDLFFNGKTVTAIGAQKKFYAQKDASGSSIDEIVKNVQPGADVLALFAEMLVSVPYAALTEDLTSAFWVGQSTIAGATTDHLAFTGKALDWEIWINAKSKLPVLMVVSHREGERQPTFTAEFTDWKLNAPIPAKTFTAPIPKNAVQLEFKPQALPQAK